MLQSDLYDYSDAYIVVKGIISAVGEDKSDRKSRSQTFKINAPFISCILKTNNAFIDNAEDLDIVMPMYNLTEYSKNYSKTFDIYGIIKQMN